MSTFSGSVPEIPGIAVDRFCRANYAEAQAFFLSHCHTDHMQGIADPDFHKKLQQNDYKLYLSNGSAAIIRQLHPNIAPQLKEIDGHEPTTVQLDGKALSVIGISAGHCPGSIMFLFEFGNKRILYTGDYRINPQDLPKFKAFYDSRRQQKTIDKIYLDTTFFQKCYLNFPTRQESLDEICNIIEPWIRDSAQNKIHLNAPAKYGYEYLFIEIYKRFNVPVHLIDELYQFYCLIPHMDGAVTKEPNITQIHSIYGRTPKEELPRTKVIRISAMKWRNDDLEQGISDGGDTFHSVCFATHPSYNETVELIKFLKPKVVEPSVLPSKPKEALELYGDIEEILKTYQNCDQPETSRKAIRTFQIETDRCLNVRQEINEWSDDLDILDSPPRKQIKF